MKRKKNNNKKTFLIVGISLLVLLVLGFFSFYFFPNEFNTITGGYLVSHSTFPRIPENETFRPTPVFQQVPNGTTVGDFNSCQLPYLTNSVDRTGEVLGASRGITVLSSFSDVNKIRERTLASPAEVGCYNTQTFLVGELRFYRLRHSDLITVRNSFSMLGNCQSIFRTVGGDRVVTYDNDVECFEPIFPFEGEYNVSRKEVKVSIPLRDMGNLRDADYRWYTKMEIKDICGTSSNDNTFFYITGIGSDDPNDHYSGAYITGYCQQFQRVIYTAS